MNGVRMDGKLGARVPRYHRIAEALRERIGSGQLAARSIDGGAARAKLERLVTLTQELAQRG